MTDSALKEQIKRRGTCKAQLTNFNTYLSELPKELTPHQRFELELRTARLELVFNDFHDIQLQIECAQDDATAQYEHRKSFETSYFSSIARAQLLLSEAQGPAASQPTPSPADVKPTDVKHTKVKLPEINLSDSQWVRKREALRTRRYGQHKARRRRQIEPVSTDATATDASTGARAQPSRVSAGESGTLEWSGATGGPPAEVVLRLHPPETTIRGNMSTMSEAGETHNGSGVVVRAEEALIVAFVLLLWVAAIALFFNRWGKIRMLEPYQPKFQQQHRQSCVLAESSVVVAPHHRASLSRGCVSYDCGVGFPAYQPCGYLPHRLRQNSVFVGSMGGMALIPESPPRRSRSAADLPALVPPSDPPHATPRSSRAASLHSAVDLRICVPSPRASRAASLHSSVDLPPGSVQVHIRGSGGNLNKPRSPRRLTITNV